jgi:DNA gyrase subunit B
MYLGSTGSRGLHWLVMEWVLLAAEETRAGHTKQRRIELLADGGCRLFDDGRPIPVASIPVASVERACTGGRHPRFGGGSLHEPFWGIMLAALSCRLVVEVQAEGGLWRQEFSRGVPVTPLSLVRPDGGTGTTLTFWPDPEIFKSDRSFSFTALRERLREVACLCSECSVSIHDHRIAPALESRFEPGFDLRSLLEVHSRGTQPVHPSIISGEAALPRGQVRVAFRWIESDEERFVGFANHARTDQGTHQAGLCAGVARVWNRRLRSAVLPDGSSVEPGEVSRAGLVAVVAVQLQEPYWNNAMKVRLNNVDIETPIARLTREALEAFLHDHPDEAEAILAHLRDPRPADPKSGSLR